MYRFALRALAGHVLAAAMIASGSLFATALLPAGALAQDWPSRPVRWIVPFPAGGTPDSNARRVAREVEAQIHQPVLVENRAGANGVIGMDAVAKARPDGYTFLYTTPAFAINPSVNEALPFDVRRDFVPVTKVAVSEGYLVLLNADVPARSLGELIAFARRPGARVSYASAGSGNSTHLAAELFNQRAETGMLHVPYKGVNPALTGLLAGDVQVMFVSPTAAMQHVRSGRLRALAYTGTSRWAGAADLPTVAETFPGYEFTGSWHGLLAPAGMSVALVERMQKEVALALGRPAVRDFLTQGGYDPVGDTSGAFRAYLDAEIRKYADVVSRAGITAE